jgi:hypothetical protein
VTFDIAYRSNFSTVRFCLDRLSGPAESQRDGSKRGPSILNLNKRAEALETGSFKMLGGKGLPSDGSFSDAHGNLVDEGSFLVGESRQRVQSTISEGREASLTNDGEEEA